MRWRWLLLPLLMLFGCREQVTLPELIDALNERQVSHCLYIQGSFPPYANGYLYAQVGQLNCEHIWNWRRLQEVP